MCRPQSKEHLFCDHAAFTLATTLQLHMHSDRGRFRRLGGPDIGYHLHGSSRLTSATTPLLLAGSLLGLEPPRQRGSARRWNCVFAWCQCRQHQLINLDLCRIGSCHDLLDVFAFLYRCALQGRRVPVILSLWRRCRASQHDGLRSEHCHASPRYPEPHLVEHICACRDLSDDTSPSEIDVYAVPGNLAHSQLPQSVEQRCPESDVVGLVELQLSEPELDVLDILALKWCGICTLKLLLQPSIAFCLLQGAANTLLEVLAPKRFNL
mmetsp:Transcript_147514/g.473891  ORF Transcript_147514/g.473891 Transcript_147514/m.473891 type:complete len:266 (+) Transcript_147514:1385-2182(+)